MKLEKGGLGGDRPVTNAFLNYIRRENVKQVFFHLYWLVFYFQSIYKYFMRLDKKKSFHTINKIKKIIKILICLKWNKNTTKEIYLYEPDCWLFMYMKQANRRYSNKQISLNCLLLSLTLGCKNSAKRLILEKELYIYIYRFINIINIFSFLFWFINSITEALN